MRRSLLIVLELFLDSSGVHAVCGLNDACHDFVNPSLRNPFVRNGGVLGVSVVGAGLVPGADFKGKGKKGKGAHCANACLTLLRICCVRPNWFYAVDSTLPGVGCWPRQLLHPHAARSASCFLWLTDTGVFKCTSDSTTKRHSTLLEVGSSTANPVPTETHAPSYWCIVE